jgi:hypothetical protein
MLYWSRANSPVEFGIYLAQYALLSVLWGTGGWLLARHGFRLRASERLISGLAMGMLLFIGLSNLLANILPVVFAFWGGALLVMGLGLWAARHSPPRGWISREDLNAWPQLLILIALILLFQFIQRGLALFDEYLHIPLVSTMAAGNIPPHFYLNPSAKFAYHYGLQVFAASLVRLGGFSPWGAWDFSRAIAISFTLVLSWIWVFRLTRSRLAGILGSFLLIFGGGARWLLLLLPSF